MSGNIVNMFAIETYILCVEIVHQPEIMGFLRRSFYIINQKRNGVRGKNKLSSMENRIRKIGIAVVFQVDNLQTFLLSEEVAQTTYTPHPVDSRDGAHLMVVHIESVVGQCGNEIGPPVLPYGGSVDVASAVNQNILSAQSEFGMHAVVMRMGGPFSPFQLSCMSAQVIRIRTPSSAHHIYTFLRILVVSGLRFVPFLAQCSEIAELLVTEKLIHPVHVGTDFIEIPWEERKIHALVDGSICLSGCQIIPVGITYHRCREIRLYQRADVFSTSSYHFPRIVRNVDSVFAAKDYGLGKCYRCNHVIDWSFLHVHTVV